MDYHLEFLEGDWQEDEQQGWLRDEELDWPKDGQEESLMLEYRGYEQGECLKHNQGE